MGTTRGRVVQVNQLVIDQADFFQTDGFTRVTGLTSSDITSQLFFNNQQQPWLLVNGSMVADAQIASGKIYFHEITGSSGIYSVRFKPDAIGYWRCLLTYPIGNQILAQDFDVTLSTTVSTGIKSSFVKY